MARFGHDRLTSDAPIVGTHDVFEGKYRERFRRICSEHGEFIAYERDRSGIDIGLHLTRPAAGGAREVTTTRVWFQLKGFHASTLSRSAFEAKPHVAVRVSLALLRFWYASAEPVFLGVYVESADTFLAESVREIVEREWGDSFFSEGTFRADQEHVSVHIDLTSLLDEELFERMHTLAAIPLQGPTFRGRHLGHRIDPLRSVIASPPSGLFQAICKHILELHGYRQAERINAGDSETNVEISVGRLYSSFEWVYQLTTQFGLDRDDDFRTEGSSQTYQGDCIVCICSEQAPLARDTCRRIASLASDRRIPRVLAFQNGTDYSAIGTWLAAGREFSVDCAPLLVPEITYCLLTSTA